jgi:hypothetical protein
MTTTEPLAPAVLAEDLRALAETLPFDGRTLDVLQQAAQALDDMPDPATPEQRAVIAAAAAWWRDQCDRGDRLGPGCTPLVVGPSAVLGKAVKALPDWDTPPREPDIEVLTDARILDVLATAWHMGCPIDDPHPARHHAPQLAQLLPAIRQLITESSPAPTTSAPTAALTTARARLLSAADEVVAGMQNRVFDGRIQRLAEALADVRAELTEEIRRA